MKSSTCNEPYKAFDALTDEHCILPWFHEGPRHNSGHRIWTVAYKLDVEASAKINE